MLPRSMCTYQRVLVSTTRRLCWSMWPSTNVPEELEKRRRFWEMENLRDSVADFSSMSDNEKIIYDAHKNAVKMGHFTYTDPMGGGIVETTYKHFLTGLCCGIGCRHCIFNFYNVPKYLKSRKTFNTSFWIDAKDRPVKEPTLSLKQFMLRKRSD